MHERSLVRALLRQVAALAEANSAGRVLAIRVRIGEFSGVEADLVASAYDDLVRETAFGDAALEIQQAPLEATCDECGREFKIERFQFQCGACGGVKLTLRGGEELLLESVTMEETVP